jgi:hypothetical protein
VARISKKRHAAIILAAAGLLNSVVLLVAYMVDEMTPELTALILTVGYSALEVWRAVVGANGNGQRGAVRVQVLASLTVLAVSVTIFVGVLSTFMGCSTTYTGAKSRTALQAYGTSGTTAVLDVDGSEVCRVTGTQSTLRVDASTAQRICKAFAPQCTWRAP